MEEHRIGLAVSQALEEKGVDVSHIFTEEDDRERRTRKRRFWGGLGGTKGCTVHSFKGWESRAVVAGVDAHPGSHRLAYVAMSRVKGGKTRTVVQALRLGDTVVVAFPGEAIAEVSIEMRKRLAPRKVAVFGYTNDHIAYITTKKVYDEGGYEAGMGLCYPETTEELMDNVTELAQEVCEK